MSPTRSPLASEYLFASGELGVAAGDGTKLTRGDANDSQHFE
jgi:hypothetical protein